MSPEELDAALRAYNDLVENSTNDGLSELCDDSLHHLCDVLGELDFDRSAVRFAAGCFIVANGELLQRLAEAKPQVATHHFAVCMN